MWVQGMAVKAGRKKKTVTYRRQRWVDSGDGVVRLKTRLIRRRRGDKAPRKDPGPRPLPRPQQPVRPWKPQPFGTYRGSFGRLEAVRLNDYKRTSPTRPVGLPPGIEVPRLNC